MEKTRPAEYLLRHCEHCLYFQEEQWDTGYCQLYKMYVLRTFSCAKFVPQHPLKEKKGREEHV